MKNFTTTFAGGAVLGALALAGCNVGSGGPKPSATPTPNGTPTPTSTPAPPQDMSKIVFTSFREGGGIFVMQPDGSNVTRLTNEGGTPAWSPDRSKIAFVSARDGNAEIYLMNADGSGQTRLTNNAAFDSEPTWSPDGHKLAFTSNRDGQAEIYTINSDGSDVQRLTNRPDTADFSPAWSPTNKIAFSSGERSFFPRSGPPLNRAALFVMDEAGGNVTQLTSEHADVDAAWSPDGNTIAFIRSDEQTPGALFLIAADGSNARPINERDNSSPSFSPDGRRIVFSSTVEDGTTDIFTTNIDGSDLVRLTNNNVRDEQPDWR